MRLLLAAGAVLTLGATGAAAQDRAACPRDLIVAETALKSAVGKLNDAAAGTDQDRCAAWRNQIAAEKRARETFARCAPDRARSPQFLATASSAGDLARVVKDRCGKQAP